MSDLEENLRPRPINGSEESDEESSSDSERGRGDSKKPRTNPPEAAESAPEQPKKATVKRKPAFSEDDLVKAKGLLKVYDEFPRRCQYKGKGRESEFLRGLMIAYKEWGYQLFPGLAFEDLTDRIEKLGGKARTRDLMRELRDKERDRVIEAKYGRSAVQDAHERGVTKHAALDVDNGGQGEDEETISSRYMDNDVANNSTTNEKVSSTKDPPSAIFSAEVRERMEANRRKALERLRLKREEAPRNDVLMEKGDHNDPMDIDAPVDMENNRFEDDEAVLAEMEAEDAEGANVNMGATELTVEITDPSVAAAVDAPTPLRSIANETPIQDAPETFPLSNHSGEMNEDLTLPSNTSEQQIIDRAGNSIDVPSPGVDGTTESSTISKGAGPLGESLEVSTVLENTCPRASQMAASDKDRESELALDETDAAAAAACTVAAPRDVAMANGGGHVVDSSIASPSKRKMAVSGRVPLSPLGASLACTDVPAEGERRLYEPR